MKAKRNWLIKEAEKADSKKNVVTLENPDVRDYLDRLLLENFWPVISSCLEESGYDCSPKPEIESELSCDLERSLSFMFLDGRGAFFRGTLQVSIEAWMLESNFFLPLPKDTDPQVVFQILGNSRFAGCPPTLTIDKERADDFYQVDFHSGNGAGWGLHNEDYVQEKIRKTINVNKDMYEFSIDGITAETIGEFLSLAYEVYEAF
ncbi:MAG: hypothetical protein ACE5DO_14650 [Desulfobacterales bacterium]